MNHHDEFCKLVCGYEWMSEKTQKELISRMSAAMSDAFERGVTEGMRREAMDRTSAKNEQILTAQAAVKEYPSITKLPKRKIILLKRMTRDGRFIDAIKLVRDLTPIGLKEAKEFCDSLRGL